MNKESIIKYNRAWIKSQESYIAIKGIPEKNHVPYPEPLQKLIVQAYADWNLKVISEGDYKKKIDFCDKSDNNILCEMKSTTSLDGAVGLTDTQAEKSNYIIWFFANADSKEIIIKRIKIDSDDERKKLVELYKGKTHAISDIFKYYEDNSKPVDVIEFPMLTMKKK